MSTAVPAQLTPGTVFAKDYRVDRLLALGGMGAVYVATQLQTGRARALKLMHPDLVRDAKLRERFAQEAYVGSRIASDHVVEVIDAGIDATTGMPWLAMELLEGENLEQLMHRRSWLPPAEVKPLFEQLCHALAAAHAVDIVHRDVKPENVFLAQSRRQGAPLIVKVLDFGIAKVVANMQSMTMAVGSPMWMAPEQTMVGSHITPATDVWALGLLAFYLLTGKCYWVHANTEKPSQIRLLREVAYEPLAPASERVAALGGHALPDGFDAWFARCVVREIDRRFASVDELIDALRPLLGERTRLVSHTLVQAPLLPVDPPPRAPIAATDPMIEPVLEPPPPTERAPEPVAPARKRKKKKRRKKKVIVAIPPAPLREEPKPPLPGNWKWGLVFAAAALALLLVGLCR